MGRTFAIKVIALVFLAMIISGWTCEAQADGIQRAGDVLQVALPAAGLTATLALRDREGTCQLAKSFATTMAVTYALKYSLDTKRPSGGRHSFPSGHTSAAFAGAGFIQQRYGWKYGLPSYALAGFVGYSRVHADRHYWHDVLAGAAIGIGSNLIFTSRYEKANVVVVPVDSGLAVGVSLPF